MRGFANHPDIFPGFAMESPLWLDSLALPDPCAVLLMLTAVIMLTNTELFGSIDTEASQANPLADVTGPGGQGTFQKYQKWVMRGAAVLFVPMTWNFPAGVFVFMSTNLLVSSVQNRVLKLPALERLLEIPMTAERQKEIEAIAATGPPALLPINRSLAMAKAIQAMPNQRSTSPSAAAPVQEPTERDSRPTTRRRAVTPAE